MVRCDGCVLRRGVAVEGDAVKRRTGTGFKIEHHAFDHWGKVYHAVPKSVWATLAWHLANEASGTCDVEGAAARKVVEELRVLNENEIIPKAQVARCLQAFGVGVTS